MTLVQGACNANGRSACIGGEEQGDDGPMPPWDETPLQALVEQLESEIAAANALVLALPRISRDRTMVERTMVDLEAKLNSAREQLRRVQRERPAASGMRRNGQRRPDPARA
jgi:hypothetical protein